MVESSSAPLHYVIRAATRDDIDSIYYLIMGLAIYEKAPEEVTITKQQLLQDGFLDPHPKYMCSLVELVHNSKQEQPANVTDHNVNIVGFSLCYYAYSTWKGTCLYLEDLYVDTAYRQHGIGLNMFRYIVQKAGEQGMYRVMWAALDWNTPAINFYNKLGAITMNEWLSLRLTKDGIQQFIDRFGTYDQPIAIK